MSRGQGHLVGGLESCNRPDIPPSGKAFLMMSSRLGMMGLNGRSTGGSTDDSSTQDCRR